MMEFRLTEYYVEIYFSSFPADNIRESLKICGWKWNKNKRCWYQRKTEENILMAKQLCQQLTCQKESSKKVPEVTISEEDLVVRNNGFYCNLHHTVEDMAGIVTIIGKKGNLFDKRFPIAYCKTCNTYFVLEETYIELKKWGILQCQIMTQKEYQNYGRFKETSSKWRDKSPLKLWGYSVSKADDLSEEQRHAILGTLIEKGLMTKERILSYLDFFIRMSSNDDNISCWREDRKYIESYNLDRMKTVRIK